MAFLTGSDEQLSTDCYNLHSSDHIPHKLSGVCSTSLLLEVSRLCPRNFHRNPYAVLSPCLCNMECEL